MTTLAKLNTPIFAAEGILHLDRKNYQLQVKEGPNNILTFSLDQLQKECPLSTVNMRLTSVSGWSVRANWDGILWRDFLAIVQPSPKFRYVIFSSAGNYDTAVWLHDLLVSTSMIVWGVDGDPLEDEYGGPLRMIIPNLWGYKSCKWLTSIQFTEKYRPGYWETRGYTHRGNIEAGETFDVNSQSYRPIPKGEVIDF